MGNEITLESQRIILSLLGESLFGFRNFDYEQTEWNSVFEESVNHSVFAIVYHEAKNHSVANVDPKWQQLYYKIIKGNVSNISSHKFVDEMFSKCDLKYVILKGLASVQYYPHTDLRTMGDVDFVVPEEDLVRAGDILEKNGLKRADKIEHSFHRNYNGKNTSWELHWSFPGLPERGELREKALDYLKDIYDKREYYNGCYVPSVFHHGLILLLHTAEHLTATGIGLRHLCDWAVYVDKIDNESFVSMFETPLKELGLWQFAQVLTGMATKYLHSSKKEWASAADDTSIDLLMTDILESGNFGRKDDQRMNQYKLYFDADSGKVKNRSKIGNLITYLSLKARLAMPIVEKWKILLPIGWIYVSIRHLFRIHKGKRVRINIKETIKGAEKRSDIYERFHLFEVE